ncbi:NitT/TauT family transport system substrate-binding protein [Parafrankia irregularis]|uniref:Thiamine pyrimidine synthase n=1 Tax=Parafrankia irregularis TaxID=795642 RepID=A0A0S4QHB8_9ACTN|nr:MULTISPECIES: ABC transporter substrate-binding protein [Parafrankia]MBE3200952.1 ABC transporter substrate-binding protein [Parafrankia sp. CH37]CUU54649.1 NitT/TauT family transport system substrate-binding protein [Parafrankia irregularis]
MKSSRYLGVALAGALAFSAASACSSDDDSSEGASSSGAKLTDVKMVLSWLPGADNVGFLAAKELGYYSDLGLNVDIQAGGPDVNAEQLVGSGAAQFSADAFTNVLTANDAGTKLVSLAQLTEHSAIRLVSRKEDNITSPDDWKGKKIGIFSSVNSFYASLAKHGLNQDTDVNLVEQGADMSAFLSGELDMASGYSYNEVGQVIAGGVPASDLNVYSYEDDDTATLEMQIFADSAYTAKNPDTAAAFVAASLKGWAYCRDNADECAKLPGKYGSVTPVDFMTWSVNEYNKVLWPAAASQGEMGVMNADRFEATAKILLDNDVIRTAPEVSSLIRSDVYDDAVDLLGPDVDLKGSSYTPLDVEP